MATIFPTQNGKFRVQIRRNNSTLKTATFTNKVEANEWAANYEKNIRKIEKLSKKELRKLTSKKIDKLGGAELFEKLGIKIRSKVFNQLADEYMTNWSATHKDPNQGIRVGHWCDVFGNMLISDIKTEMIRDEVRSLSRSKARTGNGKDGSRATNKTRSPVTVNRYKCALSRRARGQVPN